MFVVSLDARPNAGWSKNLASLNSDFTSSHLVSNTCPSQQYIVSVVPSSGRFSTRHADSRDNFLESWRRSGIAASHLIPQSFLCIISTSFLEIVVIISFQTKEADTSAGSICFSLVNVVDITYSDAAHLIDGNLEVTSGQSSIPRHEPWVDEFILQCYCKRASHSLHKQRMSRNRLHCELASHRIPIAPAVTLLRSVHLQALCPN